MFKAFYPDEWVQSTYVIDFEKMYERGYRGVIFDIDNTLVPHGAPADERAEELFARLKAIGLKSVLLSNNGHERVDICNRNIGTLVLCKARKPSAKAPGPPQSCARLCGTLCPASARGGRCDSL